MGTVPGIGLERLPTGALCSPPIHSVSGEATKDPDLLNPKPSRPPWRATSAAKSGHRAGSLPRGRAPGAALQHATHSSPATPAPSSPTDAHHRFWSAQDSALGNREPLWSG